jgi:hypothetical protein
MGFDVLRRVRWRNAGRVVGAVALVAAVVAWPRLTAPAPRVPGSQPVPLVGRAPKRVSPPRDGRVRRQQQRRGRRKVPRARGGNRRQVGRRGRGRVRRGRAVVVAPPVPARTPVAPPPAPPPSDPAQTEFGFEGG